MANMLRTSAPWINECCSHCARNTSPRNRPGPRQRHRARAREKRSWEIEVAIDFEPEGAVEMAWVEAPEDVDW